MRKSSCFGEFAKYSFLNVLGMVGLSCYILADTFFIANGVGTNGLAALNLAIPVYSFVYGCGLMLGMGGATKYSIYKGQGETKKTNIVFTNTIYVAVVLACLFILAGFFLPGTVARLLGADEAIFSMTRTYIQVVFLFLPAFIMNNILICYVRNDGAPKLAMFAMLLGSLFNIVFDYIFIYPLHMGIFGAVLATGFSPVVGMMILSLHLLRGKNQFHLTAVKPKASMIRSILSLGVPTLVTELSSGIVIIVFNIIILGLEGNTGVAAYGVVANISLVVASIYTGIAGGIQPLISRAWGRFDKKTILQILRYALVTMFVLSVAIYAIVLLFTDPIVRAFNNEKNMQMQAIAAVGMKLYFTAVVFMGFNTIISTFFTSVTQALPAQLISLLRGLFVIVPMAFLMSALFGIVGVWLAFPASELIVSLVGGGFLILWLRKRKEKEKVKNR